MVGVNKHLDTESDFAVNMARDPFVIIKTMGESCRKSFSVNTKLVSYDPYQLYQLAEIYMRTSDQKSPIIIGKQNYCHFSARRDPLIDI